MLQSIDIKKFGKWSNQKFILGKVNFLFGENEAGKTTLFDAIVYGLTNPGGTTKIGKRINERYGKNKTDKIISIEGNYPNQLNADEFINLHTLKAGGIQWDLEKPEWLDKIKQQLFSGGFDPNPIVKDLELRVTTNKTGKITKPLEATKSEIQDLELELKSLIQKKNNLLSQEKNLASTSNQRETIQLKLNDLKTNLEKIKYLIQEEEDSRKFKESKQGYKAILDWKEAKQIVDQLQVYENDRSKELDVIQKSIQESILKLENLEKSIQILDLEILNEKKSIASQKSKYEQENSHENLARSIKDRVIQILRSPKLTTQTKWNLPFLVLSMVSLLVGTILVFSDIQQKSFLFFVGFTCLVLGFVFLLFARSRETFQDNNHLAQAVRDFQREWKASTQRNDFDHNQSLDEIQETLAVFLNERVSFAKQLTGQNDILQKKESQLLSLQEELIGSKQNISQLGKGLESVLKDLGITNPEEYNQKRTQYLLAKDKRTSIESGLRDRYKVNPKDIEDFLVNSKREIESATEKGIAEPKLTDPEFQNLKFQKSQLEKELDTCKQEDSVLFSNTTNLKAQLDAELKPLSISILNTETSLLEKKLIKEDLELTLEATKLASGIFQELATEANDTLRTLSEEISNSSNTIFAENRKVIIHQLKDEKIHMVDKGNSERVIDHLSLGTKDAFYIAAKLSLCNKRDPELKLFLMDEPFLSLDEERERKAMEVVQDYVERLGWQIVILSKDNKLKSLIQEIFKEDCNLIDLNKL